jgi:hypothetical protein
MLCSIHIITNMWIYCMDAFLLPFSRLRKGNPWLCFQPITGTYTRWWCCVWQIKTAPNVRVIFAHCATSFHPVITCLTNFHPVSVKPGNFSSHLYLNGSGIVRFWNLTMQFPLWLLCISLNLTEWLDNHVNLLRKLVTGLGHLLMPLVAEFLLFMKMSSL